MRAWFRRAVGGLVEALAPSSGAPVTDAAVAETAAFVCRQHRRMPDILRLPLLLLTLAFDLWPLLQGRFCPFHRLPLAGRRQQLECWRASRLAPRRDFVRFYESLTVFGLVALNGPAAESPHGRA